MIEPEADPVDDAYDQYEATIADEVDTAWTSHEED